MIETKRIEAKHRAHFALILERFFHYAGNTWREDRFEVFFNEITAPDSSLVFIGGFEKESLVGIASLAMVKSSYEFRPFAYCDDFFVESSRKGPGRALDSAPQTTCWRLGCLEPSVGSRSR